MVSAIALAFFALVSPQSANESGLLIATDEEFSTSVRLIETDTDVRFEFTGPDSIAPTISVDVNRNGVVDRNTDFQINVEPGDTPCFQLLISESSSTICKPPGNKAKVMQSRGGQATITTISIPKAQISGDGFGFGFAVRLWSMTGHYGSSLAGGDYLFGGKLSLVSDGPNFKGDKKPNVPAPMLPALRRYQGCVNKAIDALAPLDRSRGADIRALPTTCAEERSVALDEGVGALVASGTEKEEATETMRSWLGNYDEGFGQMADRLEKGD